MSGQIEGKIAAILDRTTVIINRGSLDGVTKGFVFYVFSELGPFNDPDTGEDLGTIIQVWGKVIVSSVAERLCLAQTETKYIPRWDVRFLQRMFEGEEIQLKLPVDDADVSGWTKSVRLGTKVVSRPPKLEAISVEKEEVEALPAPPTADSEETGSPDDEEESQSEVDTNQAPQN
jgi:hypothetical protein